MDTLERGRISTFLIVMFMVGSLIPIIGQERPWPTILPRHLASLDVAARIHVDPEATAAASTDFGRLTGTAAPAAAVFRPSSDRDIAALLRFAYGWPRPFTVAPRGHGHSIRGQASAPDGVVIDMRSLSGETVAGGGGEAAVRIRVWSDGSGSGRGYVDAGGEQLWVDVLHETLKHGMAPSSWTDYLYLTVGGTLSNAGVSGQAFRYGPQISNVYQLDVVTGKGEMMTCSRNLNPDLFYAVLGGLGQFGIITRARIALQPAPERVRWVRMVYTDFAAFTKDQEYLISLDGREVPWKRKRGFDYVEGSVFLVYSPSSNWRSSFFSTVDSERIRSLAARHGAVYCLEGAMYYGHASAPSVEQDVQTLLEDLSFVPGFAFTNDVSYMRFLNRVREGELKLRSKGLWDVPHPWLNVFVPKSRILDFGAGVFKGVLNDSLHSMGPILIYPLNRDKWDERMSSVIPDEDIFYSVGLLWTAMKDNWEQLEEKNQEVLRYCDQAGIGIKQYLPHYKARSDWMKHFGPKWDIFLERKRQYDPKRLLSPGQGIFAPGMLAAL
uniref:cytokinin dehydrogenase n=1 Tax=Anthurium amnicola TaxID=1678845 RepID=A0A1D1YMI4_9ARAE